MTLKNNIGTSTNILSNTFQLDYYPVSGLYVKPESNCQVEEIHKDLKDFKDCKILIAGTYTDRYFLEWIYNCRNEYLRHDFDNCNKFNEDNYVTFIKEDVNKAKQNIAVLYLFGEYYWNYANKPYESKMSQMLESKMDLAVKKDKYAIFISKESE